MSDGRDDSRGRGRHDGPPGPDGRDDIPRIPPAADAALPPSGPSPRPRPVARRPVPTNAEREAAAAELSGVRDRIDALDRQIVELLNERAALGRSAGRAKHVAGRRAVKDPDREREVLLRVAMHNAGPLSQADLLSIYRRIVAATRGLESRDRTHDPRSDG